MSLDEIVEKAVKDHCEDKGYSDKLTNIMLKITKKYRAEGVVDDSDLESFLKRVETEIKDGD